MSLLHMHLLLNHVPVIGMVFVIALFATALFRRNDLLSRFALLLSAFLALVTVAVYFTGGAAEEVVEKIAGVAENTISTHEEFAELSTIAVGIFGTASLLAALAFRKRPLPRFSTAAGFAGAFVAGLLLAWTANLGGNIRHTELQSGSGQNAVNAVESQD